MSRHKSYKRKDKREPFTFDFDGEPTPPFTARGGFGAMILELGELAKLRELEVDSAEGMAAIAQIFELLLGETEYERFRKFIRENGIDADLLVELVQDMFTEVVGHPLAPPSESSAGPTTPPRTYKVISLSDGSVTEQPLTPEREAELIAAMEKDLIPGSD
jgi:hypothetical protein